MSPLEKFIQEIKYLTKDEGFLHFMEAIEGVVSKVLSLAMVGVILYSVIDLIFFLFHQLLSIKDPVQKDNLFEIFGLFLNVLIALEILENISGYLKKHVIQVELVIVTSLIAVARKIIILDLEKKSWADLMGLAFAILALSVSYWLVRQSLKKNPEK
jgi:uncharacterized membrane protein (DUF373 family)